MSRKTPKIYTFSAARSAHARPSGFDYAQDDRGENFFDSLRLASASLFDMWIKSNLRI